MRGVAARYPVYSEKLGKMQSLEQRINQCRTENMQAKAFKWESKEMLSMTIFVRNQSRGMPMNVSIDGPAIPFFEKGKKFYFERRGQLDMACKHCHEDYAGGIIRANTLTQGQSNGFPTYRLKWQKPGSIHRRFRGCARVVGLATWPGAWRVTEYRGLSRWSGRALGQHCQTDAELGRTIQGGNPDCCPRN